MKFSHLILLTVASATVSASAFAGGGASHKSVEDYAAQVGRPVGNSAQGVITQPAANAEVLRPRLHITFKKPAGQLRQAEGTAASASKQPRPNALYTMKISDKRFPLPVSKTIQIMAKKGGAR